MSKGGYGIVALMFIVWITCICALKQTMDERDAWRMTAEILDARDCGGF